jgi:hypothetical protein
MEHSTSRPNVPANRRKFALIWVDSLVIAAAILGFGVIVIANNPPNRSSTGASRHVPDDGIQTNERPGDTDPGLVRARIRLANGGPWS